MMRDAVRRADTIIRGMLDFSRPAPLRLKPGSLADVIESSLLLVEKPMESKRIHLTRTFGKDVPQVSFDENQMKQVFINLMMNAVHAMPRGGQLSVRCRTRVLDARDPLVGRRSADSFKSGTPVVVAEVADSGAGIPKEKLSTVFNPFFTTKPPGEGTGLGLAVTRSIVENHKGRIVLESELGVGTTVTITLPTDAGGETHG